MTAKEIDEFVHSMTYEDAAVSLHGRLFWCLGLTYDAARNEYAISVYEDNPGTGEWVRDVFKCKSAFRDECMRHFLEDRYWDGKSFHEIAHDLEWAEL